MDWCDQFLFIHFTPWHFNDNNADFNKITRAIYTLTQTYFFFGENWTMWNNEKRKSHNWLVKWEANAKIKVDL